MATGSALPRRAGPWWLIPAVVFGAVFGLAAVLSLFQSGQKGWAWALLAALLSVVFLLLRSALSRDRRWAPRDGVSSGGDAVFRGGSSGGGGASGRW